MLHSQNAAGMWETDTDQDGKGVIIRPAKGYLGVGIFKTYPRYLHIRTDM